MKVNELRIGNWLERLDGSLFQVNASDFFILSEVTESLHPKSIPLTEEWLLKFGFEISTGGISYDKGKLSIYLGETILSNENGTTYFNSWKILEYSPKYVHQLQNLYFALMGEELTLQP